MDQKKLEQERVILEDARKKFEAEVKSVKEAYKKKKEELTLLYHNINQAKKHLLQEKEEFEELKRKFYEANPEARKWADEQKSTWVRKSQYGLSSSQSVQIPEAQQPGKQSILRPNFVREFSHIRDKREKDATEEEIIQHQKNIERKNSAAPLPIIKPTISKVKPKVTTLPPDFQLPPARPIYELVKESLPFIPPKVFEFSNIITNLRLSQNKLDEISEDIGKLSKLVELDICYNNIESIPSGLLKCNLLQVLLLAGNPGIRLPTGMSSLKNLTTVSLCRNNLTTLPEQIASLPALEHMDISFNNMINLTPKIGEMTSLCTLVAGPNNLTSIPKEIKNCINLAVLDLKENSLTTLCDEIGSLQKLEELIISDNKIKSLPSTLTLKNLPNLFKFDAYNNQITEIPKNFFEGAENGNFEELHLGRNKVSSLPDGFWNARFVLLDLKNNNITELPPQIGELSRLAILDVSHNKLKSLPSEIIQCTYLMTLNLFGNDLQSLPEEFKQISQLRQLYLGYNKLTNVDFLDEGFFEELEELFIGGNPITHITSKINENTPRLRYLYLNNMKLKELPTELGNLYYLEQLDASFNQLTTIPAEINQLRGLYSVDFSHNNIVNGGEWEEADWTELTELDIIDLSYNQLKNEPSAFIPLKKKGSHLFLDGNPFFPARGQDPKFNVGWCEMVGRRPSQEDRLCITGQVGDPKLNITFYGLFDGHCGQTAATYASENFVQLLLKKLPANVNSKDAMMKCMEESFPALNEAYKQWCEATSPGAKHCGSTAIVLLIVGAKHMYVSNVGDARAVLYNGGDSHQAKPGDHRVLSLCKESNVIRMSKDHKPDDEEDRIRGVGSYVINSRIDGVLGVARSIGDLFVTAVSCIPHVSYFQVPSSSDWFVILACDGVWDEVYDVEACSLVHSLKDERNLHRVCVTLRDYAYYLGSEDNISVMIIKPKGK